MNQLSGGDVETATRFPHLHRTTTAGIVSLNYLFLSHLILVDLWS
jgi:hypothetical protein